MYRHILVAIENSDADQTIVEHVAPLAKLTGARLLLVHVADGWAARHYDELNLRESEEMQEDRAYLGRVQAQLTAEGLEVDALLAMGDPAKEICRVAEEKSVDLIAMATHGHRGVSDVIHGQTVDHVRHRVRMPVLLLRAKGSPRTV
ncbi:MAG TPA: universal stress protein [Vicinamibacterales bacterium]|jgi:nucleotide-binding universal stress UspA family protein